MAVLASMIVVACPVRAHDETLKVQHARVELQRHVRISKESEADLAEMRNKMLGRRLVQKVRLAHRCHADNTVLGKTRSYPPRFLLHGCEDLSSTDLVASTRRLTVQRRHRPLAECCIAQAIPRAWCCWKLRARTAPASCAALSARVVPALDRRPKTGSVSPSVLAARRSDKSYLNEQLPGINVTLGELLQLAEEVRQNADAEQEDAKSEETQDEELDEAQLDEAFGDLFASFQADMSTASTRQSAKKSANKPKSVRSVLSQALEQPLPMVRELLKEREREKNSSRRAVRSREPKAKRLPKKWPSTIEQQVAEICEVLEDIPFEKRRSAPKKHPPDRRPSNWREAAARNESIHKLLEEWRQRNDSHLNPFFGEVPDEYIMPDPPGEGMTPQTDPFSYKWSEQEKNLLGQTIEPCTSDTVDVPAGYFFTGYCDFYENHPRVGSPFQGICVEVSEEFLRVSEQDGLDFRWAVQPGGQFCISTWVWAALVGRAPKSLYGLKLNCEASNAAVRDAFQKQDVMPGPHGMKYRASTALKKINEICGSPPIY
eukprot:gnl/TRDRNA2_/TRDRNA2_164181_c0_seq1.p1 gnl/TRDRNA2_/TRDRNA2_164181_c0~~gnl/TRDRNA2_/TRDRNA2_164181_c0_seq1.p1  ORF type:complete len:545 (+),score=77.90 gnl/TRDRNA2_/TRDRNA2_164181_c0_seq1:56-1690(+)